MNQKLTQEERDLFQALHEEKVQDSITFEKRDYRGLWRSVTDKYKEKAHFVYELLQNADDAQASEATFQLLDDRVVFRHNGKVKFSISRNDIESEKIGHINAITSAFSSTKINDNNKIGKFGVGFKAVFAYTETAYIYDDKFHFKIEQYIVPSLLDEDFPGREEGETVFVLPLKQQSLYTEIKNRLEDLKNPILFLNNLKLVKIDIPGEEPITYSKEIKEQYILDDCIHHEVITINNNKRIVNAHMFSEIVSLKHDDATSGETKEYSLPIYVVYLLNEKGEIDISKERKVYCYFQTEQSFGLKCIVHAPFLLVDSRQNIKDDKFNESLIDSLSVLASVSLSYLRDYGLKNGKLLINENIFSIFPKVSKKENVFTESFYIWLKLGKNGLLLNRNNEYVSVNEAYSCNPKTIMDLLSDEQLSLLFGKQCYFLKKEVQLELENFCNLIEEKNLITTLSEWDFVDKITPTFMDSQGIRWAKKLYMHAKNEQRGLINLIKQKMIIYTKSGKWCYPHECFLPIHGNYSDEFEYISPEYDDDCIKFFINELGIAEPDRWDHIANMSIQNDDIEALNKEFELLYNTVCEIRKNKDEYENALSKIQNCRIIKCNDGNLRTGKTSYLDTCCSIIYWHSISNHINYCIDRSAYKTFIKNHSEEEFDNFITELGVKEKILYAEEIDLDSIVKIAIINNRRRRGIFYSKLIEGFNEWQQINLKAPSISIAKTVWKWLILKFDDVTANYQKDKKDKHSIIQIPANALKHKFETLPWVVLGDGRVVKPCEAEYEELESLGYEMDKQFLNFLGIEPKEKDLEDLGASKEQKEAYLFGKQMKKLANELGISLDELPNYLSKIKASKERAERRATQSTSTKSRLSESSFEEMSRSAGRDVSSKPKNETPKETLDEQNERIEQEGTESINKKKDIAAMRDKIDLMNEDPELKYNKEWFDTLLELEYSSESSSSGDEYGKCDIKIDFTKFEQENGASKFYLLSEPSRFIPYWIEDIDGLEVVFFFTDDDSRKIEFDVASVKDFTLKVKAKDSNLDTINEILNKGNFTRARVEVKAVNNILDTLKKSFANLPFDDDFNFKENLGTNLGFIFGPPGTGKTTRLAELITEKMNQPKCRILVLAPTNKACDVITTQLIEKSEDSDLWLGRFVATGEESIESAGVLIKRESNLWRNDKCCIVSTMARLPFDGVTVPENKKLKDIEWDLVIIDEASMIPLSQIVYAIYKMKNAKFIVAGDPMQIAPIVKEELWKNENIYTMVKLDNFENPQTEPIQFEIERLTTQYRSVPAIGNLYSQYCYDNCLQHHRNDDDIKQLNFGALDVKPVTFVPFRVERFDSIFGAKKMQGSNVQVYSAIFTVEMCLYIAKQQTENVRIGIICPYSAQAQLIKSIIEFRRDKPDNVEINVGTIHGFQGDECDIIFAVFNPPTGLKGAAEKIMLNNRSIINVAISRASDYLFILMPHSDTDYYDNLVELKKLCSICKGMENDGNVTLNNCENFEENIFEDRAFIEKNTFVTSHQLTNVYTQSEKRYEVHIDEKSVDIQLSGDGYEE